MGWFVAGLLSCLLGLPLLMRTVLFILLCVSAGVTSAAESFVSKTPLRGPNDPLPYLITINDPIGAPVPQSQLPAILVPGARLPVGMWGERPFVKSCITQPPLAPDQALTKGTFNDKAQVAALLPTLTANERQQVFEAIRPLLEAGAQVEVKFPKATEPTCEMGSINEGTLVTLTRNRLKPDLISVDLRISRILEMPSVPVPGTTREVQSPKVAFREVSQVLEVKPGGRQSLMYPSINNPGEQAELIIEQRTVMTPMGKGGAKAKAVPPVVPKVEVPVATPALVPAVPKNTTAPANAVPPFDKGKVVPASTPATAPATPAKMVPPATPAVPPGFKPAMKPIIKK